jgi:hypothetical protein
MATRWHLSVGFLHPISIKLSLEGKRMRLRRSLCSSRFAGWVLAGFLVAAVATKAHPVLAQSGGGFPHGFPGGANATGVDRLHLQNGRAESQSGTPVADNAPPAATARRYNGASADDPLIEKARAATFEFSDRLPNFICQEYMSRYSRYSDLSGWQPLDVISAEIIYEGGQETYRNLKINDRPTDKKMTELSGSWSTGEFATTLNDLFHPSTGARFRPAGASVPPEPAGQVYDFDVQKENSHWHVQIGEQSTIPAYHGSVWIDPATSRVLRVEIQARNLPSSFAMDAVESAVDYAWVRIGTDSVLLPSHAESLGCQRGTKSCSRNIIDFRNYRKYTADSKIIFGGE